MSIFLRLFFLAILFLATNFTQAVELSLVSADFDPYTYATPNGGAGAMYEVVQALAARIGQSTQIKFLPWARAQIMAQENPNIGILPTARVPERESKYVWIIEIVEDPYVFIKKKNSKADISSINSAKSLRIGVFRGSLAESLLKKWGFQNVNSFTNDAQCVKMLKLDRLDAWVAPLSFKSRYKEKGGLGDDDLKAGAMLVLLHEYLAASKTLDFETILKWRKAFEEMKRDGSYARIMKKYNLKPLK